MSDESPAVVVPEVPNAPFELLTSMSELDQIYREVYACGSFGVQEVITCNGWKPGILTRDESTRQSNYIFTGLWGSYCSDATQDYVNAQQQLGLDVYSLAYAQNDPRRVMGYDMETQRLRIDALEAKTGGCLLAFEVFRAGADRVYFAQYRYNRETPPQLLSQQLDELDMAGQLTSHYVPFSRDGLPHDFEPEVCSSILALMVFASRVGLSQYRSLKVSR